MSLIAISPGDLSRLNRAEKIALATRLSQSEPQPKSSQKYPGEIPFCPHVPTERQSQFLRLTVREALYGGSAGGGKALDCETAIPTLYGWKAMAHLRPGDYVFGMDGEPTAVIAVSPIMPDRECWRLTFDDGSSMVADADHRWLTYDAKELVALTARDPEWRAARRAKRPSRALGRQGPAKSAAVALRNQHFRNPILEKPSGTVRTTAAIAASVRTERGRTNHAIPLAAPLHLLLGDLPMDPYLLGVWLGDGYSSSGTVTTADDGILEQLGLVDEIVHQATGPYAWRVENLTTRLRKLGLLNNKHVPGDYLWAYRDERLALLQALMDTDGCADQDGRVEFCSINEDLARSVFHLAISLGLKATVRTGRAMLNGKDCGLKWRVHWSSTLPVFRLARKRDRLGAANRRTTKFRYIVAAERVPSVPVRCIQVDAEDGMFLAGESMIPTHNSDCLLMAALQHVEVPGYSALIFRRSYADLSLPGALMDRAGEWLRPTAARWHEQEKTWQFPSGATITFGYLEHENSKFRYQGAELQACFFDELSQFSESSYRYLFSRLRRKEGVGVPIRMRSASNPGAEWVKARFIDPHEDSDRVFVPARLSDNPYLDREEYEQSLMQLDPVTRRQLLEGDWEVRPEGKLFKREWFQIVEAGPAVGRSVRFWDLASTETGDYSAGCKLRREGNTYCIEDVVRGRWTPHDRDAVILQTAHLDGRATEIVIEQEPGSSGVSQVAAMVQMLAGFRVSGKRSTGDKITRAGPLASQMEAGNVKLLSGAWAGPFIDELCSFPSAGVHDDQADSAASAFLVLAEPSVNPLAGMHVGIGVKGWMAR